MKIFKFKFKFLLILVITLALSKATLTEDHEELEKGELAHDNNAEIKLR